jgi:uncharacterized protein (TIGR02996 family)
MTDEPALLAAIADRPDDDTPRLVYADWLDDHGAADRAEFIRLQCMLARDHEDDPAAAERADELENQHRIRWLAGVPTGPGLRWSFHRGFPGRLEASTAVFLDRYDRIAAVPWLSDLLLTEIASHSAREFVSRAWSPGWRELELWGVSLVADETVTDDEATVVVIASSRQASQLRALRLSGLPGLGLSRTGVEALAVSRHLHALQLLAVPGDPDRPLYAPLRARFGDRLVGEGV